MSQSNDNLFSMKTETERQPKDQGQMESTQGNRVTGFNKNRTKRTRAYRKLEKKQNRTRVIAIAFFILASVITAIAISTIKKYSSENLRLENELSQAKFRIESMSTEMQNVRLENDTLVQGRIPGLIALKFDDPYKLENQTLKSIVFTHTKHNGKTRYEFLAVVHNVTEDVIRPASSLIFFNQLGVEVGKTNVAITEGIGSDIQIVALQPGESHSLSGSIEMTSEDEPRFFKLISQGKFE